jgi:CrcB protein
MLPIVIFLGAGVGGVARYAISQWVQLRTGAEFPYGTLVVNVTGSLVLTFLYGTLEGTPAAPEWRAYRPENREQPGERSRLDHEPR